MSQHSQLAAGSGIVPADGQIGDFLGGPTRFLASRPPAQRVATVGVEPASFLRRAILWRAFGVANVAAMAPDSFPATPADADAVVVDHLAEPPPWDRLLEWAGHRTVVVDVQIASAMAAAAGHPLRIGMATGEAATTLEVMCHQENRTVYPEAPAVDIVAEPPVATGMTTGDRVHLYAPSPIDMGLRVILADAALDAFLTAYKATLWGRAAGHGGAALISFSTPAGGLVTIMDLHTVDRRPEPCGSETPGIHLLLSLLGRTAVTFGRFGVPHAHYCEFVETLEALVRRHPRHAAMERFGRSVEGRDMWLFKIARQPDLPVVLLSNVIHPYEWGPLYGVLRYLNYLLEQLESGGFEAEELLATHQVWWVPSACPDGFDNRQQQPTAINLNRNFPGGWEHAAPGEVNWGSFGSMHSIEEISPISLRGPGPASQPETQALMSLMHRDGPPIVTLADFHENVGTSNFLHQVEHADGSIPQPDYHAELIEGVCQAFSGRYYEQRNNAFYRVDHSAEFSPGRVCGWLGYAVDHGAKGCVVEASGGDCTHYRTVRRTEYGAQVVEQVLAAELGRLWRNPWGEDRSVTLTLPGRPEAVTCRLYAHDGRLLEETMETRPAAITRTVPAGGCLRLRYSS